MNRLFSLVFAILTFGSCQVSKFSKVDYQHPIPYEPAEYICYKTDSSLIIDGKLDEAIWQKALPTNDFQDILGALKPALLPHQTYVKMLWDDEYFYFGAYLEESHIWGSLTERDDIIFHDNDFEIFIDPDGDSHHYFEFEINALNTIWDLILLRPYRDIGSLKVVNTWDIRDIQSAVYINGTINQPDDVDSFWTIEIAIPLKALNEITPKSFRPKDDIQWRVNFSRVHWHLETVNGQYQKQKGSDNKNLPEENWVWSPQGYINLHAPETWGYVQFSEIIAGQGTTDFKPSPDEDIKWALRQLYHQQRRFFSQNKQFATHLKYLTIPKVEIENYSFKPKLLKTYKGYEIVALSADGKFDWVIREDGEILKYRN